MTKKQVIIRKIIQKIFFGIWLLLLIFIYTGSIPVIHLTCPYASVCFGSMLINRLVVYLPIVILGLLIVISTVFWGRKFCGYVCFLGTIQEYIFKLNPSSNRFNRKLNSLIDKSLKYLKYVIFILTVALAMNKLQYMYMGFCPLFKLAHPFHTSLLALIILALILILCLIYERFWCRYLCPYAAMMNIFQLIGKLAGVKRNRVKRNIDESLKCRDCPNYCPMNIDFDNDDIIENIECIHCLRCVRLCFFKVDGKKECLYGKDI